MPSVRFEDAWVPGFRSALRTSTAEGWSVREHRGGMRLQVRQPGEAMQTIALPFDWAKRSTGDALVRIRNIYALVAEGHTLRSAEELLHRHTEGQLVNVGASCVMHEIGWLSWCPSISISPQSCPGFRL